MYTKELDLSKFKSTGATLDVVFDITGTPGAFIVLVTNQDADLTYYKRTFNKAKLSINLPVIPQNGIVLLVSGYPIKTVMMGKLRKISIPYQFNKKILQKRPYAFNEIKETILPYIPTTAIVNGQAIQMPSNQPARFHPGRGEAEYSEMIFKNLPQPTRVFVREHEKGHYYYGRPIPPPQILQSLSPELQRHYQEQLKEDEQGADDYALHKVLNAGYNFTGALDSLMDHLPDGYISQQRIRAAFNRLNYYNKKYFG